MTEKFTPGEWHIWKDNSTIPFIFGEDGYAIACMCGKHHNDYSVIGCIDDYLEPEKVLANANLIASAPKMYRELDKLKNIFITFSYRLLRCKENKNAEQWMKKAMEIEKLLREARG